MFHYPKIYFILALNLIIKSLIITKEKKLKSKNPWTRMVQLSSEHWIRYSASDNYYEPADRPTISTKSAFEGNIKGFMYR